MGINVTHVKDTLLADGVNKVFPFTFPVMDKADVKCLYVLPSGEETDLLATEYEVKLTETGGEVTYPLTGDALAEGCKLVIYRETPRTTDYNPQNTTTFDAETISKEIERLTMENQEQDEKLSRAVSTGMGSEADPKEYLNEINRLLSNASEMQDAAVETSEKTLAEAEKQKNAAAASAAAAAASAKSAADTVNGFDAHAADKTTAFNNNAASKQALVDASASAAAASAQEAANSAVAARPLSAKNITNCITAIPQDIKLELVDGVMTLKAGSKVYKANGESITISGDLVVAQGGTNTGAFAFYRSDNSTVYTVIASQTFSGTTAPANPVTTTTWLDTGAKDVKVYDGTQWVGGVSLPLCIFDNQDGKVTAVTQVFNGMGYIGNSVYALPGVKGLVPNGFNADGSLNNAEFEVANVLISTNTGSTDKRNIVFNNGWMGHPRQSYYNIEDNRNYRTNDDETGIIITATIIAAAVEYVKGRVTSLTPKTVFHAVDYNDYAADIQKCKLIAYDASRNPGSLSGSYTLVLQDNDERVSLKVADNVTINIDTSRLTFPEEWYTVIFEVYFTNGAKTVNLSYAGGIRWVNGLTPDFTNGRSHLVALTKHRSWGDVGMSDAGSFGG
jgi:hypothetical protein